MRNSADEVRERITLVATNVMRIAGIQEMFGDPCGVDFVVTSMADALQSDRAEIVMIDAGSVAPLFQVLARFQNLCPDARLIVIGLDADETYIECVIGAGAKGFVGGSASTDEFRTALENVKEGSIWAPRRVLSHLVNMQVSEHILGNKELERRASKVRFTPREDQIITLLIGGQSNRDIGCTLGINPVTVKSHLGRIMRKAGVGNRVELTMYVLNKQAMERRLPNPGGLFFAS